MNTDNFMWLNLVCGLYIINYIYAKGVNSLDEIFKNYHFCKLLLSCHSFSDNTLGSLKKWKCPGSCLTLAKAGFYLYLGTLTGEASDTRVHEHHVLLKTQSMSLEVLLMFKCIFSFF